MLTVIESPFRPDPRTVERFSHRWNAAAILRQNIVYARLVLADCLDRGEVPFASHLLYTQVWDESAVLRAAGIRAGVHVYAVAERCVLATDLWISEGMTLGRDAARLRDVPVEERRIFPDQTELQVRVFLDRQPIEWPELRKLNAA